MTDTAFERVIQRLREQGCKVVESGGQKAGAQCPAHEDGNASLSVTGISGQALIYCHAGCGTSDVLGALGLTMADLYDERSATYRYDDGRTVHRRYDGASGKKRFSQTGAGPTSTLYHLAQLREVEPGSGVVHVCEGEKDVHAIEAAGGVATTAPQGSKSFHKVDVGPLAGHFVAVIVDRDEPGRQWAEQVRAKLAGVAKKTRFYQAKVGKDAADHIAAGHGLGDFERIDLTDPEDVGTDDAPDDGNPDANERLDRLRAALVDTDGLEDIPEPEPLIPGVLYKDSPAWLYGEPGCGKSFVAIDMAGCVGTGEPWQGYGPAVQGPVLYLVAEGVTGIKQRVRAWEGSMGTKMTGVHFLPVAVQASNNSEWQAFIDLAAEIRPALIVIDTQARITVGMEENSNTEMGMLVHRIEQLRKASGACVLTIHHTGRSGDHMRGAIAIDGAATTTIKVDKDEEILNLTCTKQKDAPEFDPFRLRLISYQESAILSPIHGSVGVDTGQPAVRKMLVEWWDLHGTDWVSLKVLEDSKIVKRTTFYRSAKALENMGVIKTEGKGNSKKYRMENMPQL